MKQTLAFVLALVFCVQSALASSVEGTLWSDRRTHPGSSRPFSDSPRLVNRFNSNSSLLSSSSTSNVSIALLSSLSSKSGTLRGISVPQKSTGKIVIHIQDVHQNPEAQGNIRDLVQTLILRKQIGLIALEGAFGPVDLSPFQTFPYPDAVKKVADFLFQEQKISGAADAALTNGPVPLVGIDDDTRYNANVNAYRRSLSLAKQNERTRAALRTDIAKQKARVFPTRLARFDRDVESFRKNEISLGNYIRLLSEKKPLEFSDMRKFLEAWKMESAIDFSKAETERDRLMENLSQRLGQVETSRLLRDATMARSGETERENFYTDLANVSRARGIKLSDYPALTRYMRYLDLSNGIDGERLFEEIRQTEKKTYDALIASPAEKEVVDESRHLFLVGKLLDFTLTTDEWKEYKETKGRQPLPLALRPFEEFYEEAEARDQAMAENLIRALNQQPTSTAVLVTGGFHSAGIDRLLNQAGIVTLSYVPRLTHLEAASSLPAGQAGSAYLSVFTQEKTPLEKLFETKKLSTAPPPLPSRGSVALKVAAVTNLDNNNASVERSLVMMGFPNLISLIKRIRRPSPRRIELTLDSAAVVVTLNALGAVSDIHEQSLPASFLFSDLTSHPLPSFYEFDWSWGSIFFAVYFTVKMTLMIRHPFSAAPETSYWRLGLRLIFPIDALGKPGEAAKEGEVPKKILPAPWWLQIYPFWIRFLHRLMPGLVTNTLTARKTPRSPTILIEDRAELMEIARSLWSYYEVYGDYLIPDRIESEGTSLPNEKERRTVSQKNQKKSPNDVVTWPTSPTNIGYYLDGCAAADTWGFIQDSDARTRIGKVLQTLWALPNWNGLFFNYDAETREQTSPIISSVDNGNLAASLRVMKNFCRQKAQAAKTPEEGQQWTGLADLAQALRQRMEFQYIFDWQTKQFYWTFDVGLKKPFDKNDGHFDRYLSEARLTVFEAIAEKQIPPDAVHHLLRPIRRTGSGVAVVPYFGTMMEKLTSTAKLDERQWAPHIWTRVFDVLINEQIRVARKIWKSLIWGLSESGVPRQKQKNPAGVPDYWTHGVHSAAETDNARTGPVIAPYASIMAIGSHYNEVMENIRAMKKHGLMGPYGPWESARLQHDGTFLVNEQAYAHHQGMSLDAIFNLLEGNLLKKWYADSDVLENLIPLIQERPSEEAFVRNDPAPTPFPKVEFLDSGNGRYVTTVYEDGSALSQGINDYASALAFRQKPLRLKASSGNQSWRIDKPTRYRAGFVEFSSTEKNAVVKRWTRAVDPTHPYEIISVDAANTSDHVQTFSLDGEVELVRQDTGQVVATRAGRQGKLDFFKDKDDQQYLMQYSEPLTLKPGESGTLVLSRGLVAFPSNSLKEAQKSLEVARGVKNFAYLNGVALSDLAPFEHIAAEISRTRHGVGGNPSRLIRTIFGNEHDIRDQDPYMIFDVTLENLDKAVVWTRLRELWEQQRKFPRVNVIFRVKGDDPFVVRMIEAALGEIKFGWNRIRQSGFFVVNEKKITPIQWKQLQEKALVVVGRDLKSSIAEPLSELKQSLKGTLTPLGLKKLDSNGRGLSHPLEGLPPRWIFPSLELRVLTSV